MAFIQIIEDEHLNRLAELVTTLDMYMLPNGNQWYVGTVPAWCRNCARFVLAEDFESPDEMERKVRSLYEWSEKQISQIRGSREETLSRSRELLERELETVRQWRMVMAARYSAPRCLECGGTDYEPLKGDGWLAHPAVEGQRVRARINAHASMATLGRFFDTEGRQIADKFESSESSKEEGNGDIV